MAQRALAVRGRLRPGRLYPSRFTGDACVAVFDRSFGKLKLLRTDELVRHAVFLDTFDDYGIALTEPPG